MNHGKRFQKLSQTSFNEIVHLASTLRELFVHAKGLQGVQKCAHFQLE